VTVKELSLYKIRDMALNSGASVYNSQELSNLINKNKNIALVYMNRLIKNGLAIKLTKGKISFIKDDFIIASQLISPSYVSLNSALLFHNISYQVPEYIECVNTINSFNYYNLGIIYHKIRPELFFGYKRYNKDGSFIFVANPDKAVFDGLYFKIFSKFDIKDFKKEIDFSELLSILKHIKINGIKKIMEMLK
jgi:predicted transcriptional regulator of viral defense system